MSQFRLLKTVVINHSLLLMLYYLMTPIIIDFALQYTLLFYVENLTMNKKKMENYICHTNLNNNVCIKEQN